MEKANQTSAHVPFVVNTLELSSQMDNFDHEGSTAKEEDDDITNTSWIYEEVTVHSSEFESADEEYEEVIEEETLATTREDYRYSILAQTYQSSNKVATQMGQASQLPILPPFMEVDAKYENKAFRGLANSTTKDDLDARMMPFENYATMKLRKKATSPKLAKPDKSPRSAIDFPTECTMSPESAKLVRNVEPDSLNPVTNCLTGLQLEVSAVAESSYSNTSFKQEEWRSVSNSKTARDFRYLDDIVTRQRRIYLLSSSSKERHFQELVACDKEWKKLLREQLSAGSLFSQEVRSLEDRIDSSESSVESFKKSKKGQQSRNPSA